MKTKSDHPTGSAPRRRTLHGLINLPRRAWRRHPKLLLLIAATMVLFSIALPHGYTIYLATRWPVPDIVHRSESSFVSLMVRAGDDASGEHATMSPEQFRRHLNKLTNAGYQFIGVQDVQRFMREGRLLPPHAVLIGVDYRGSTRGWEAWKMAVIQSRARAVMFIDPTRSPRPAWRVIHQTSATPHWDIAAGFHEFAIEQLRDGEADDDTLYTRAGHYNRLHAMDQAAVQLHRRFRSAMRQPSAGSATALAYPYYPTNTTSGTSANIKRHLLARNASPHFKLGFVPGKLAINTDQSDPWFLNSRVIPAEWDERTLIQHLRAYRELPFETPDADGRPRRAAWITIFGSPNLQSDHLRLESNPGDVTGLWLTGSDQFESFDVEISFAIEHGILRVPFMANADESHRWELLLDANGRIELLRRRWDHSDTIAVDRRRHRPDQTSRLHITQRHNQLLITLDEQPLFNGWVPMNEPATQGLMGLRLSTDDDRPAAATIDAFRVMPPSTTIAVLDGRHAYDTQGIRWTAEQAQAITALSPSLEQMLSADSDATLNIPGDNVFSFAVRIHGWDLLPHVNLSQPRALEQWTPEHILFQLRKMESDGIFFRMDDNVRWPETSLADWGRRVAETLTAHGYRLFIRLPSLAAGTAPATATLGRVPGIQWVSATNDVQENRHGAAIEIQVPASEPESDLRMLFDFLDSDRDFRAQEQRRQLQRQRDRAETLYARGEYEDAITIWFDWHELDPHHPVPLRRIGDALQRLGYHDESIEFYRQSLDRNPGNIELAVLLADWLDASGRHAEARNLLFVYDLLFPDQPSILLAQAVWFQRHNHLDQSRKLFKRLLELQPDHLQSLLMIARLGVDATERRNAMQRLLRMTQTPEKHRLVLEGIRDNDLLVLPEAETLLPLLDKSPADGDHATAAILDQLRPRDVMAEVTAETMDTQTAWRVDGAKAQIEHGRIRLRATPEREEAALRLNGSERWHDVYLEADLVTQRGEFWLTARRSRDHMVRFGFDDEGDRIRLQIWRTQGHEPRLLKNVNRQWSRPEGGVRLRLEIRGTGATGYIDGKPWGPHAILLPDDVSQGWVGIIARSVQPGEAQMALRRVAAGPLFPAIARFNEPREPATMDRLAERLHSITSDIDTISPSGFAVDADGLWSSEERGNDVFSALFARFHAFRLTPHVLVEPGANLRASDVLQASKIHGTDGFVFEFTQAPHATIIDELERDLREANIDVFLLIHDNGSLNLRGLARSRLLLPGKRAERRVSTHSLDKPADRTELRDARRRNPILIGL